MLDLDVAAHRSIELAVTNIPTLGEPCFLVFLIGHGACHTLQDHLKGWCAEVLRR
jgi:hypothetical protein